MDLSETSLERLPSNLTRVERGGLFLHHTKIKQLPTNLTYVHYDLDLGYTPLESLPDNLTVNGNLYLANTKITELPKNLNVGGGLSLWATPLSNKYTKEQLAREIPIGKEMVDTYLDGKMPKGLQPRHRNHYSRPVFQNVLISPADLGLLPPRSTSDEDEAQEHLLRNGHHKTSKLRMKRRERERQRRRLYDNNTDLAETDGDFDLIVNDNKKHLFDLP